ncbi:MAG: hypothetical protein J6Q99_02400 [Oscillospiraceae bacterium]|nr:hypothetical protein [Oscillospiraceae bacterium]
MELFWIIVCYLVVLGVCFLLGEYLRDCRIAKGQKQNEEQPEVEVLPDPRQTAQMLSRRLEQMAVELAACFGLQEDEVKDFFAAQTADDTPIIDVEEEPPQE